MKIFIYGTLQKGHSNHRVMQDARGVFIGKGTIQDKHIYFVRYGSFPAVVDGKGIIHGEVWDIPETKVDYFGSSIYPIQILDRLEGYDPNRKNKEQNMYERRKAQATLQNGEKIWVSYYHWNGQVDKKLWIRDGDWAKAIRNLRQ